MNVYEATILTVFVFIYAMGLFMGYTAGKASEKKRLDKIDEYLKIKKKPDKNGL